MLAKIHGDQKALPNPGWSSMLTEVLICNNFSTGSQIPHLQNGVTMSASAGP